MSNRLRKHSVNVQNAERIFPMASMSKSPQDAQKGQTSHPPNPGGYATRPALSLPRQPLDPGTRRSAGKAAAPKLTFVSRLTFHGLCE